MTRLPAALTDETSAPSSIQRTRSMSWMQQSRKMPPDVGAKRTKKPSGSTGSSDRQLMVKTLPSSPAAISRLASLPDAAMPARHHHLRNLHRLGEFEAVVTVDRQPARRASIHQFLEIARLVFQRFQQIGVHRIGFGVRPGFVFE